MVDYVQDTVSPPPNPSPFYYISEKRKRKIMFDLTNENYWFKVTNITII